MLKKNEPPDEPGVDPEIPGDSMETALNEAQKRENAYKHEIADLNEKLKTQQTELHNFRNRHDMLKEDRQSLLKKIEELSAAERLDLTCKEYIIASLEKELEKKERDQKQDAEKLALELHNKSAEFRAALVKERGNFKAAYEKLEDETHKLKEALVQKSLEMDKLTAEIQDMKTRHDIIKSKLESNLSEIKEQSALVKSALAKLKENS